MKRYGMILGMVLIAVCNVVALLGVARNRAGDPVQSIDFSERELVNLGAGNRDDSSVRLRIDYTFPEGGNKLYPGFDQAKMKELGFIFPPVDTPRPWPSVLPREAFVALELRPEMPEPEPAANPPVSAASQNRESGPPQARPFRPQPSRSRLVAVDASLNYDQLRSRYADSGKHLILRVAIRANVVYGPDAASGASKPERWDGSIMMLLPPEIQVPLPHSRKLAVLEENSKRHFIVTLHYGRKLEPWVGNVVVQEK